MAKQAGLGDNFYFNGFDLSGNVASLDGLSTPIALLDVTPIKQSAHSRILGLRDGVFKFTSYWENIIQPSTPGFPASGNPVSNTYPEPVLITITGGTLTNVSVNGSTVGTTAGTYVLPVGGNISVTYSVAPTWNWFALGGEHEALKTLLRSDLVGVYFRGTAMGSPAACILGKQLNYDPTRDNKGALTVQAEIDGNGFGMEWGVQLTPGLRTDTAATNGASLDNGAATAFGAQAYVQLVDIVGTNVDIAIQHSVDNATWNTLIDFGSISAITGLRAAVSNSTTVNRYLRVATSGTFSYVTFSVAINRNPVAGVVF